MTDVLRQVSELVAVLHGYGVVLGDISHANCLFRLDPTPAVYTIDCDGYFPHGGDRDRYVQTPDWDDPLCPEPSYESDAYKLALLAARALRGDRTIRPGRQGSRGQPYGAVDGYLADLIDRAGGDVPSVLLPATGPARSARPSTCRYLDLIATTALWWPRCTATGQRPSG